MTIIERQQIPKPKRTLAEIVANSSREPNLTDAAIFTKVSVAQKRTLQSAADDHLRVLVGYARFIGTEIASAAAAVRSINMGSD